MKRVYRPLLSLLLSLSVLLCCTPLTFHAAANAMKLRVINNFSHLTLGDATEVQDWQPVVGTMTVTGDKGVPGGGQTLTFDSENAVLWNEHTIDHPASAANALDGATGLLFYIKAPAVGMNVGDGLRGSKIVLTLMGTDGQGGSVERKLNNWTLVRILDLNDKVPVWKNNTEGATDGALVLPAGFEGYVRIDLSKMTAGAIKTLTSSYFTLPGFGADAKDVVLGSLYAVLDDGESLTAVLDGAPDVVYRLTPPVEYDPVLHLSFDEGTIQDTSVNAYAGQIKGSDPHSVTFVDGIVGKAVHFGNSGTGAAKGYLSFGKAEKLQFGTGDFAFTFWYKSDRAADETPTGVIAGNKGWSGGGTDAGYILYTGGEGLGVNLGYGEDRHDAPGEGQGTTAAVDADWHHIAVSVARAGELTLYVDGQAVKSVSISSKAALSLDAGDFHIGADGAGQSGLAGGSLDEFIVYNKALTPEMVGEEYETVYVAQKLKSLHRELDGLVPDIQYEAQALADIQQGLTALETALPALPTMAEKKQAIAAFEEAVTAFYAASAPLISFAVGSDVHVREENWSNAQRVLDFLADVGENAPEASTVLLCGDLTENGTKAEMELYFELLGEAAPAPVLSALGNHDVRGAGLGFNTVKNLYLQATNSYLGSDYESVYFDRWIDGYHFIVLNTEKAEKDEAYLSEEQLDWFAAALADGAQDDQPIFVILHQPLNDTHPLSDQAGNRVGEQSAALAAILARYPQTVLFTGHVHNGFGYSEVIDDGKGILVDVPSMEANPRGESTVTGCWYVSVYPGCVKLRARDFGADKWLTSYDRTIDLDSSKKVDKTELRKRVYTYQAMTQERYSNASWNALQAALKAAKAVLADGKATAAQVTAAQQALVQAKEGLVLASDVLAYGQPPFRLSLLQAFGGVSAGQALGALCEAPDGVDVTAGAAVGALGSDRAALIGAAAEKDGSQTVWLHMPADTTLADRKGLLVYLRPPKHKAGDNDNGLRLSLRLAGGKEVAFAGGKLSWLDKDSQSWVAVTADEEGWLSLPYGFEGYVRIRFEDLPAAAQQAITTAENLASVGVAWRAFGGSLGAGAVGAVYGIDTDTGGLTALLDGNQTEHYLTTGRAVDPTRKPYRDATMRGEVLEGYYAYAENDNGRVPELLNIQYAAQPDNATATIRAGLTKLTRAKSLVIHSDTGRAFWRGDGFIADNSFYELHHANNIYLDNMQALMFYAKLPTHPGDEVFPDKIKLMVSLHSALADGSDPQWTQMTAQFGTGFCLPKGKDSWEEAAINDRHILLPSGFEGYVLIPTDQFTTNPVKSYEGRQLIDTTFLISALGGSAGDFVLDAMYKIIDMGSNNRLFTANGDDVYSLVKNAPATEDDLQGGGSFPGHGDGDLIDALPEATTNLQIHDIDEEDVTNKSVTIDWDLFEGAHDYRVEVYRTQSTAGGLKFAFVNGVNSSKGPVTIDGLQPGTVYYAVVYARDEAGVVQATYGAVMFMTAAADGPGGNGDDGPGTQTTGRPGGTSTDRNPATGAPLPAGIVLLAVLAAAALGCTGKRRRC